MNDNYILKRAALLLVVLIECSIGGYLLWRYYQYRVSAQRVLGAQQVAIIPKEIIVKPEHHRFAYYSELKSDTKNSDHPEWLPYEATYFFNSDGLNDRFNYPVEKPADTYRIMTLGDSFTFGHYVNTADSWPEQLEELQNSAKDSCDTRKVEVINLGMWGFDIPYIVERYKTIGAKYQPDLIIWFESGSGFFRYNELMQPLIAACEQEIESNEDISLDFKKDAARICWLKAEEEIKEKKTAQGIMLELTAYLDDFFELVDPNKLYYLTYREYLHNEEYAETLNFWKNRYQEAHIEAVVPSLSGKEVLPDAHPSPLGQKKIANSIHEYLQMKQAELPSRCL